MASTSWNNLPYHISSDIMMMAGLKSIKELNKYRKVCFSWNVMINQMTKLKRDTIRRTTESLASQIRRKLLTSTNFEIVTAASLAHHGMLGFVEDMWLGQGDVDLASIPAEHMV